MAMLAIALGSCTPKLRDKFDPEKHDFIDQGLDLSREDYKNVGFPNSAKSDAPKIPELINTVEVKPAPPPPVPTLSDILAAPRPPEIGKDQLVSIAVTDDVPLKDVLLELSRLANVDMELDSGISGGISFVARNRPFNEVIHRIAEMVGLRYQMKDNILKVERDLPYIESYSLDFLNMDRSATSSINISTNVLSAGGGGEGGAGGLNSGSSQSVTSTTQSDFWNSLQSGIKQILNYSPKKQSATTESFGLDGSGGVTAGGNGDAVGATGGDGDKDCVINGGAGAGGGAGGGGDAGAMMSGGDCQTFYTINRQAGMLTISGTKKQHDLIHRFIDQIKVNASAQVLIEAKIVEVSLSDKYQSGVEWGAINRKLGFSASFNNVASATGVFSAALPTRTIDGVNIGGDTDGAGPDLEDFLQLVQDFGTTRTLSSPRLHAINNQQAVLTFAQNYVYFDLSVQQTPTTSATGTAGPPTITVDSAVKTVPIGIILTLQPSINTDSGEITLAVRPTLSRIQDFIEDPAVAFISQQAGSTIVNKVPIVEVREMDSILKLKSGQVMVIGGLMESASANKDTGLPGAAEVPWFGNLFKSVTKLDTTKELVIFIRATLVTPRGNVAGADKEIYKNFSKDPRPLNFNHY
jgi:general secretion pathway protein D